MEVYRMKYEVDISFFPYLSCDKITENRNKALNSLKSLNNVHNIDYSDGDNWKINCIIHVDDKRKTKAKTERILHDRINNIIVSDIMLKGGWRSAFIYNSIKGR